MIISSAVFLQSNTEIKKLPEPDKPEYAFIGRSNVGKSSLINMLTAQKGLAKTSGKPGKTVTINHFLVNDEWYLVDLPGYGYAKRSKTARAQWQLMLRDYLLKRQNLVYIFVLVDVRHEPQANDLEFINWLAGEQLPLVIVFTKGDKLGKTKLESNVVAYKKELLREWEELPYMIVTSAVSGQGRDELLGVISAENENFARYSSSIIK